MKKVAVYFLGVTFVLTYIFLSVLALTELSVESTVGSVFLFVGGSAPTIVAFVMVHRGAERFKKRFYHHLGRFKVNPWWFAFVILVPLILGTGAAVVAGRFAFEVETLWLIPLFVLNGILFGGLEEVGWRGFLQEKAGRHHILLFGVVFGIVWGVWHLPMFYVEGLSHYEYAFLPFLLQGIVLSLFITWVYAHTRSLPLVVLFHAMINTTAALGLTLDYSHAFETYLYLGVALAITCLFILKANTKMASKMNA